MGILDDNNLLWGAYSDEPLSREKEQKERSSRRYGIAGLVLSVLWIFGFGSLFGLLLGGLARVDAQSPFARRLSNVAMTLGAIGLLAAMVLVVVG